MVFCNNGATMQMDIIDEVTILILIDGFLQLGLTYKEQQQLKRHNPYFNRWFSAMQ